MENPIDVEPKAEVDVPAEQTELQKLNQKLEEETALRLLAEEGERNAKRDIVAMKKGKKRDQVDASELTPEPPAPVITQPPAAEPASDLQAQLEEERRKSAELARALSARTVAPVGGGSQAPSPSPKPLGYWSEAQKAELKARGWSDAKIATAEKTAQFGTATAGKSYDEAGYKKRGY
jgi:hypothetical protein